MIDVDNDEVLFLRRFITVYTFHSASKEENGMSNREADMILPPWSLFRNPIMRDTELAGKRDG